MPSLPKVTQKTQASLTTKSTIKKITTEKTNLKAEKLPKLVPTVDKQGVSLTGGAKKEIVLSKPLNGMSKPSNPTSPTVEIIPPALQMDASLGATEISMEEEIVSVVLPDTLEILEEQQTKAPILDGVTDTSIETTVCLDQPAPKILNGNVTLVYEQYNEIFEIIEGSTTHANIDDVYCLSFVMPDCVIHLSVHSPIEMRALEIDSQENINLFVPESPLGVYKTLEADRTYYVYVIQKAEQLKIDQERMKLIAAGMTGATVKSDPGKKFDDGRVIESCSCVYGNPCVDEYGCKDWDNRAKVASANGWKGF